MQAIPDVSDSARHLRGAGLHPNGQLADGSVLAGSGDIDDSGDVLSQEVLDLR